MSELVNSKYVGKIVCEHKSSMTYDLSIAYPNLDLYVFVIDHDEDSVEIYLIIKSLDNALDELTREHLMNFICTHSLIDGAKAEAESTSMLLIRARIVDAGTDSPMILRTIDIFGDIIVEIGHHVKNGKEEIWGLYSTHENYKRTKDIIEHIFGKILEEAECWIAPNYGLEGNPPLLSETFLCNRVRFDTLRLMLDNQLRGEDIDVDAQEGWPSEFYQKTKELLEKVKDMKNVVELFLLLKIGIKIIAGILFPGITLPDP